MRRAVFHLVLWPLLAGLGHGASATARHHARASVEAHATAARVEACADLPRSRRKACEARRDTSAKAQATHADAACAKLPRRRRGACEREAEAASRAEAQAAVRAPRRGSTAERAVAGGPSPKRGLQPEDLVGGVEPAREPVRGGAGAPALRGSLSADVAVPIAAGRAAARSGRASAHLREVVLEDGQSLADLAARTGVSVADLARLNGVASPDDVPTGMRLKLPPGARAATPRLAEAPPSAPEPPTAAPVRAAATPVLAAAERPPARGSRAERRASGSGSGPRPYASLGPEGAAAAPATVAVRGGRTQADALAAYAVASARAPRLADRPEATHERFVWPLRSEVVSGFGAHGLGRRNDGVDLAARPGDAVRAAAAGEVVYAGKEIAAAGGNLVLLKHADGWVTAYSHLGRLAVGMRQTVEQGQEIAEGADVAGASVHFEVREPSAGGAKPVDPVSVLPARGGGDTGRG